MLQVCYDITILFYIVSEMTLGFNSGQAWHFRRVIKKEIKKSEQNFLYFLITFSVVIKYFR